MSAPDYEQTTATQEKSSLEEAVDHPDRKWWHMPPSFSFKENPDYCHYRTLESDTTRIEFVGQKEKLENTAAIFMTPTYHQEWRQGNIQSQLFELLTRDYSPNTYNIEIVFLLNELHEDRYPTDSDDLWNFRQQFPAKPASVVNPDDYPEHRPGTDYSSMTADQFLEFRELQLGKRVPYPEYLYKINYRDDEKKAIADKIVEDNNNIISFFESVSLAQELGRIDTSTNQALYRGVQERLMILLEKYDSDIELLEIIKLSFLQAKHVNVSMLNLLNVDFAEEGYQDKGIASIRTIGMDYARIRYGDNTNMIAQPLDGDSLPSESYVKDLREYYERTQLECTQVPVITMVLPGMTKQLTETGVDSSLGNTYCFEFPPMTTRCQSSTLPLLAEINGVSGEPVTTVGRDEDYYLGRRMGIFADTVGGEKYRQCSELPPIAICMVDRPGWVDGYGRDIEVVDANKNPGDKIFEELRNEQYQYFLNPETYQKWLTAKYEKTTDPTQEYVTLPKPPDFEFISNKYKAYINRYYEDICLPQSQRNRNLFGLINSLRNEKNGIIIADGEVTVQNWDLVPQSDRFDLAHFLKHHTELVSSMTNDDWEYTNYLLGGDTENDNDNEGNTQESTKNRPAKILTKFQIALREYIGIPEPPENILNNNFSLSPDNNRDYYDRRSFIYSANTIKLAYDLCIQNFFQYKINGDGGISTTNNEAPVCFDSFENRSVGLNLLLG